MLDWIGWDKGWDKYYYCLLFTLTGALIFMMMDAPAHPEWTDKLTFFFTFLDKVALSVIPGAILGLGMNWLVKLLDRYDSNEPKGN